VGLLEFNFRTGYKLLGLLIMAEVHGNRTHLPVFGRYTGFEEQKIKNWGYPLTLDIPCNPLSIKAFQVFHVSVYVGVCQSIPKGPGHNFGHSETGKVFQGKSAVADSASLLTRAGFWVFRCHRHFSLASCRHPAYKGTKLLKFTTKGDKV